MGLNSANSASLKIMFISKSTSQSGTPSKMLRSCSSPIVPRKMFEAHPGFRKRYPRGGFWSGYEHYESTGLTNLEESSVYLRDQQQHHNVTVIDDRSNNYLDPPSEIRQRPIGLAEERRRNGIIRAEPLFHYLLNRFLAIVYLLFNHNYIERSFILKQD